MREPVHTKGLAAAETLAERDSPFNVWPSVRSTYHLLRFASLLSGQFQR
jgi:hypothetical protein